MSLRILIADDHPVFRHGLRLLLHDPPELAVVGEAATGTDAVDQAARLEPDVVVMDLHLPDLNGIDATRRIVAAAPNIAVVVLTMFQDDDSVFAAMRAGARGYLLKGAGQEEIVRAVRAVAAGEAIFGPAVAARILSFFSGPGQRQPQPFPQLTEREREVLELVASGMSNQAIAQKLVLNQKTVRNSVSNIFTKLHVADRAQAIIRAREAGFGKTTGIHQ